MCVCRAEARYGDVEVQTLAVDFSKADIYGGIRKTLGTRDVGILVNNVGVSYDYAEYFHEVPDSVRIVLEDGLLSLSRSC